MSDAPIVQVTDTQIIYRASALGSCYRKLWAARTGHSPKPPPPALQQVFDEGHRLEPIILRILQQDHHWVYEPNGVQREVTLNLGVDDDGRTIDVIGHVDHVGTEPGGRHYMPIDAKSFSQSTMDGFLGNGIKSYPHYAWQQSVYAIGLDCQQFCLPLYNKDTEELVVKVYDSIPYTYEDIQNRVYQVEELARTITDPSLIHCDNQWGCPYDYLHDTKQSTDLPEPQARTASAINNLNNKIKTLTSAKKTLSDALLSQIPYDDINRSFEGFDVKVTIVENPKRLNTQKVKELITEAGLDLDEYYTPGEGVQLRIKEK